jgi:hypothetical protein
LSGLAHLLLLLGDSTPVVTQLAVTVQHHRAVVLLAVIAVLLLPVAAVVMIPLARMIDVTETVIMIAAIVTALAALMIVIER